MNEKETFVIEYLKKNKFVDVLDAEFMCAFAEKFHCKYRLMSVGAPKVPLASQTLAAMHKAGLLERWSHGLSSFERQGGFPKWVYSYELAKPNKAYTGRKAVQRESKYRVLAAFRQ